MGQPTILHVTTSLGTGGMERQLLLAIQHLPRFTHVVICLQKWGAIGDELQRHGVSAYFLPTRFPWSLTSARKLREYVRQYQPRMMITYLPLADLFGRLWGRWAGIPKVVCSLHSTMRDWRYFPFIIINNLTQFLVNRFFAVSQAVRAHYERWGLRRDMTDVVPNGVELVDGGPAPDVCDRLRIEAAISGDTPLIGYVGQLRKERGHLFLIRVLRLLKSQGVKAQLVLVGSGPHRAVIEEYARTMSVRDWVTFLGLRTDVTNILRCFTVYAHPSKYEGMSVALLEAMAAGCAIVTTDIPENREVLGSESALLVGRGDETAFAHAIIRILSDERLNEQLRQKARQRVQSYDINQTARVLEQAISAAL